MALSPGTQLGAFEILDVLGTGGMGEVYRATDTRLRREVALKILPHAFANDPSRLERFEREAHVLASLNHPHIAAIYGFEHVADTWFLVLELVEGPTLAEKLTGSGLRAPGSGCPLPDALRIATEIAEALEAAHEKGIVHRDLKPANVKLTADGKAKVLDFGLAKALGEPGSTPNLTHSPTLTLQATRAGVILGTAAYMSPEQADGRPVDKRADVWAFGVVLYEMLTGRRAFDGKTVSHIIVNVIEQDPDWNALPATTPTGVRELLERCLQKDPARRLRDIGDVRLQLQALAKPATSPTSVKRGPIESARAQPTPHRERYRWLWPSVAVIATLAAVSLAFLYLRQTPPTAETTRFEIVQPGSVTFTSILSLSPDGRKLAFIASGADGVPALWIRSLDLLDVRPLAGTERVSGLPFWSPDGRFIAYRSDGKLKKIDAAGGPPQTLCDVPGDVVGGFWTKDNRIVFGAPPGGLLQVAAGGGTPSALTTLDRSRNEIVHVVPSLLPDGRHFIYLRLGTTPDSSGTYVGSLDAKPEAQGSKRLVADQSLALYAPSTDGRTGYLLFARGVQVGAAAALTAGTLMAQPFDARKLEVTGDAVPIAEQVPGVGFSVSKTGVLAYRTGTAVAGNFGGGVVQGQLTWLDRQGKVLSTIGEPGAYAMLALSPDGSRVAASILELGAGRQRSDVWLLELTRGVSSRFTFAPGQNQGAAWSPDSSRVVFASNRGGHLDLYQKPSNGLGSEELLLKSDEDKTPTGWSPDGRFLAYRSVRASGDIDLWMMPMTGAGSQADRKPFPFLRTQFNERGGAFSPDTRWIAYLSNESGKDEVYVRPFDASSTAGAASAGAKWLVSKGGGGGLIHWRADGKELFYLAPDGSVMAVAVTINPVFQAGVPKPLFKTSPAVVFWEVSPDGQKFLFPVPEGANSSAPYRVVLNWTTMLER